MKKNKAIVLLSIVCFIMVFVLVMSFLRFSVGIHNYNSVIGAIDTDYDVSGGVSYTLTLNKENDNEVEDINEVLTTISSRLDALGYKAYNVSAFKPNEEGVEDYSIRISVEETESVDSDIAAVVAYGSVKFYGGNAEDPTTEILAAERAIASAKYAGESATGDGAHLVAIEFTDYGYDKLVEDIKANDAYYLKISVGDKTLLSGSITADAIVDKTIYINTSSEAAAKQTAMQIKMGGVSYKYDISGPVKASPILGENSALFAGIAIAVLLVVVMAVFIVLFRGYGIIASLALLAFALIEECMFIAVPGVKLSILGIVGAGLATILCIDGLILTIKRIREEFANGKTVKASIKTGYRRSFFPILNTHVIAGVIALSLFAFTKGALQSFAITFGIGVVVSFLANILLSRMFTALVLPLAKDKETFLNLSREAE